MALVSINELSILYSSRAGGVCVCVALLDHLTRFSGHFCHKYANRCEQFEAQHTTRPPSFLRPQCLMHPREKFLFSSQTQPRLTRLLLRRVQETPQVYRSRSPEMDISDIVKRNHSVTYVGNFRIECLGTNSLRLGSSWRMTSLSDNYFHIDRGKSIVTSAAICPSIGGSPFLQFPISRPTSNHALTTQLDSFQTSSDHR